MQFFCCKFDTVSSTNGKLFKETTQTLTNIEVMCMTELVLVYE